MCLPVIELLSPLSNSNQFISTLSLLQFGCQSVDGFDVSIIHCHILQIKHTFSIFIYCVYLKTPWDPYGGVGKQCWRSLDYLV